MSDNQNKKDSTPRSMNKLTLIDLKRRLSKEEYSKVMKVADEAFKEIERSLPDDLKGTLAIKAIGIDKRASHSQAARLVGFAGSLSVATDPKLSMKIIEANREIASEIGGDRETIKSAIQDIGNVISRKYKLRNALYGNKGKSQSGKKDK